VLQYFNSSGLEAVLLTIYLIKMMINTRKKYFKTFLIK